MDLVKLLNCLSDGEYHSGVELGVLLGVSRTAVWKALSKLEEVGVVLEATKGRGYRIKGGIDLLDREVILGYLTRSSHPVEELFLLQSVDSTNSYLMAYDDSMSDAGYTLCFSEQQTAGRGRRGRTWHSPYARNLYLSLSFSLPGGGDALEGLSLALGVAVARCLEQQGGLGVGLKWPNDIWVEGKKLAGILVELKGEAELGWKVVAGLGINVLMSSEEGEEVGQPWTSLGAIVDGVSLNRSGWAGLLAESLIGTIERYKVGGLGCLISEWERFDILKGNNVVISGGAESGLCEGIDERGRLLVNVEGELKTVNAGEVSVRPDESSD